MAACKPKAPATMPAAAEPSVSISASANAPFIYFDDAPVSGVNEGVARITLEANRVVSVNGKVVQERIVAAHLRMSMEAAHRLRKSLDRIMLIASAPPSEQAN